MPLTEADSNNRAYRLHAPAYEAGRSRPPKSKLSVAVIT